jgi:hypothetical protein
MGTMRERHRAVPHPNRRAVAISNTEDRFMFAVFNEHRRGRTRRPRSGIRSRTASRHFAGPMNRTRSGRISGEGRTLRGDPWRVRFDADSARR